MASQYKLLPVQGAVLTMISSTILLSLHALHYLSSSFYPQGSKLRDLLLQDHSRLLQLKGSHVLTAEDMHGEPSRIWNLLISALFEPEGDRYSSVFFHKYEYH